MLIKQQDGSNAIFTGMTHELALLIPHFNQPEELEKSLLSVSCSIPLLILIVDDGSNKKKKPKTEWINNFKEKSGFSVNLLLLEKNYGIDRALNFGLEFLTAIPSIKYIVRLDCGDTNAPGRIDKQYEYMEANSGIFLLGSSVAVTQNKTSQYVLRMPLTHHLIRKKMFVNNCFVHPAVIIRVSGIKLIGMYPTNYPAAEDFAYFFKFVKNFRTANLPDILLTINKAPTGISLQRRHQQLISRIKVILHNFEFNLYALWGLIQSVILLAMPTNIVEQVKKKFFK